MPNSCTNSISHMGSSNEDEEKDKLEFEEKSSRLPLQYLAAISANLAMLVCGVMYGWTSPVLPRLMNSNSSSPITDDEATWITSIMIVGSAISPFPSSYVTDMLGRKKSILIMAILFLISFGILMISNSVPIIYTSRFIGGFASGWTVLPVYISEIASPDVRGALMVIGGIFLSLGFIYVYSIGPFVSFFWLSFACTILPLIFFLSMIFMPESPYYDVKKGHIKAAEKSLIRLRGKNRNEINEELKNIQMALQDTPKEFGAWSDLIKRRTNRKALFLLFTLLTVQQLSGNTILTSYSEDIFRKAGSSLSPEVSTILVGVALLAVALPVPYLIEKLGRRPLQLVSTFGMTICTAALGTYFYLESSKYDISQIQWIPLVTINGFIIFHSIGIGSVTGTIMGEMFDTDIRSKCTAACGIFANILGIVSTKSFYSLTHTLGNCGTFWLFSALCFFGVVFIYFYLPETKGKTLEKIQEELNKR